MMDKFKVNDDQMTLASGIVGDIYEKMAQELMFNLIKRMKQRGSADLQREPWLWQLEKLNDMHMLNEQNAEYIVEQTGIARELFDQIIKNEGLKVYKSTQEQLAEDLGKYPPHNDVKTALESYAQQAFRDVDNLVNQTLLSTNFSKNPVMKAYQSIIETSVAEVISGVKNADQAVNDTVMKWLAKGFPSDFVDKAGRRWNIDSYARMVTQSTAFRVYNDMRTRASEEMGVETFYYSMHGASRPACAPIQGKVVTKGRTFRSKTLGYRVESLKEHGWGTAGGALGANCKHYLTPFVIGVNTLPEIPEHLKNLTPKQAIDNGKKQAQQRAYERAIKDDKYKLQAAKLLGDDRRVAHYQNKLGIHRSGLNQLLKENDFLHQDSARERIYKTGKAQEYAKLFDEANQKAYNNIKKTSYSELDEAQRKIADINEQKNNRHIKGTYEFKEYVKNYQAKLAKKGFENDAIPSILNLSHEQSQKIIEKLGIPADYPQRKTIVVDFNKNIGYFIDEKTGKRYSTKKAVVSFSKSGTHITPVKPTRKGEAYIEI